MNKIDYTENMSVKELTDEINKRLRTIREMLLNDDDRKIVELNFKAISEAFKNVDKRFDRLDKRFDDLERRLLNAIEKIGRR